MPRPRTLLRPWPLVRLYSTARSTPGPSPLQRELFRRVAQPVAVLTAHLPSPASPSSSAARAPPPREEAQLPLPDNHGATLSSLSSISLSPPLVSFSLRLPSRLASFLSPPPSPSDPKPTFNLHLLTPSQESLARLFARQAPLPAPATPSPSPAAAATNWSDEPSFEPEVFRELERGGIGSMRCTLVQSVPLWELGGEEKGEGEGEGGPAQPPRSQLFIAQVEEVRLAGEGEESGEGSLVYWEQGYHGVGGGEAKR
ncbi:hypothetical protein JCM1840_004756 [Sporobolomyces johnsonii]